MNADALRRKKSRGHDEVDELDSDSDEEDEDEDEFDDNYSADGDDDTDNVGDPSVEINVEELISALESEQLVADCKEEFAAKRRLEELMESRRAREALEDFDDYDV